MPKRRIPLPPCRGIPKGKARQGVGMAYVQIDPLTCEEVVELFLSKTTFSLLVNEWGRNVQRDEKIRFAVYDVLDTLLASGAPVYLARRVHGRTFFSLMTGDERNHISPRMFQEVISGHDDREWICFDREELVQAMPQLREKYPEPVTDADPWLKVMKNMDNLDYRILYPESMEISWEGGGDGKAARAAKDAELEQVRAELAALREENAALKAELEEARQAKGRDALKWYGLIAVVEQCRNEGKTPQETAAELKKGGASFAIIGGLLHPEGNISDWLQYGKNLVEGKTKKLAW